MKRRFVLTPEARSDLIAILSDIAEDNTDAAGRLRLETYDGFQKLARSPGIGHYHDELLDRRYRFWNLYSYVVCYVWQTKPIQVIAVVHGRRDLVAFFSARTGDS